MQWSFRRYIFCFVLHTQVSYIFEPPSKPKWHWFWRCKSNMQHIICWIRWAHPFSLPMKFEKFLILFMQATNVFFMSKLLGYIFYNLLLPISLVPKSNDVANIQFLIPISNDVSKRQCVQFTWSPIFRSTESVHLFGHLFNWQETSVHPEKHLHIFILNKSDSKCLHDSIVVSIPACHAGDRGSIPRRGAFF